MKSVGRISFCAMLALLPFSVLSAPASAQDEPKFKIHFDYSKVQESLFTADVKRMLESGAALLASYIHTEGEVTITVVDGDTAGAFATGAPSEWETDTAEKSIAKTGGIRFGTKFVMDARDKGSDITALVMHEIMHCLGSIDSAKAIAKNLKPGGMYEGPNAMKMNNGKPVAYDGSHFKRGFKDVHGVMPRVSEGGGDTLSILDLAILADLGYDIPLIKNAGGKVPPVSFHFPENYYSMTQTGPNTKARMLRGDVGSDILEGREYTIAGKKGGYVLAGGGGGDVLIAGPGEDIMDANGAYIRTARPAVPGKATYVFRHNSGNATIYGFESGRDKIYLDPEKGIGVEKIEEALKAAKEQELGGGMYVPGAWVIKSDDFQIIVHTTDDAKPKMSDFVVGEWKPGK